MVPDEIVMIPELKKKKKRPGMVGGPLSGMGPFLFFASYLKMPLCLVSL